jgi:predicted dehydrogenase
MDWCGDGLRWRPLTEPIPGETLGEPLPDDRPVRWGILSTGKIATLFVEDLALLDDCEVVAVGARTRESAVAFAETHAIPTAYGDYRALVEDPHVDVIYIGTPHSLHRQHVELAFDAGKPVLCEKALTVNAAEARALIDRARAENLFLMEAMWMRCQPLIRRLQQWVQCGDFGVVKQVRADFGFVADVPPADRLLDLRLGGGALLDIGIYPLAFANLFLGDPTTISATGAVSEGGVDLNIAIGLGYDGGAVASLTASLTSWTPGAASIATNLGRIDLPSPFHRPSMAFWTCLEGGPGRGEQPRAQEFRDDARLGHGYTHEALEVVRCLRGGQIESPLVPLERTLAVMQQMDRIREILGVRYPVDQQPPGADAAGG